MMRSILKIIVSGHGDASDPFVRGRVGKATSIVGMCVNIVLFAGKLFVGLLSGSVAIVSDSINNLSDAATCFINLFGFYLSGKPADRDHPFGHGRIEYITGLVMSFLILMIGFEFLRTSVGRILHPSELYFAPVMAVVLLGSILCKLWLFFFYRHMGKAIQSQTILAASVDSVSDMAITFVTLGALLFSIISDAKIDGYVGVFVSLFVLYAGYKVAKDALSPLLGREPDPEIIRSLHDLLRADAHVLGVHDVIVHDYGPGRMIASAHVEVCSSGNFVEIHDAIDLLEKQIAEDLHIPTTIHMDPIDSDDALTNEIKSAVQKIVSSLSEQLSIHDFRMVTGKTHTNLIFDIAVPCDFVWTNDSIRSKIDRELSQLYPTRFYLAIQFDRSFL